MSPVAFSSFLGVSIIPLVLVFYLAAVDVSKTLSPQGCRMSYMLPSYIRQTEFNSSWSPLASRYSLWLYREAGWESNEPQGVPVLFIPGNAGSSHQVRSIASSAARQFYSEPYTISPGFSGRSLKPLDFFTVEFNEDLSALHGPTIDSQVAYCASAITYILAHYPPGTTIIVIGHSMGGIVATSLLPSGVVATIITMSTPHTLPPARFDSRIDKLYEINYHTLLFDPTPIISLCGGATDMMIASESCILPTLNMSANNYRRSIFTSSLEGAWTGVGHREMVWCHQVRWRVAKAALELGAASSQTEKEHILDTWLRDGQVLPPELATNTHSFSLTDSDTYEILPADVHLILGQPRRSSIHLLPVSPSSAPSKFVLFVSQGSILPVSPPNPISLRISVHVCSSTSVAEDKHPRCSPLYPQTLKLIPNPTAGKVFPIPDEGTDESEGVVLFEAEIPPAEDLEKKWIGVVIEDADGRGWVIGGLNANEEVRNDARVWTPFLGKLSITLPNTHALRTSVFLPSLLSNSLVVYSFTPRGYSTEDCAGQLMSFLLSHTAHPPEIQYYPLIHSPSQKILLHSHGSAPYIPKSHTLSTHGIHFIIYSSGPPECNSNAFTIDIKVDWWSTIGRCATRYPTTLASWSVGVAALLVFGAWEWYDQTMLVPTVQKSLALFSLKTLPKLLIASFVVSFIPLPEKYYLGNNGQPAFAPLAPLLLLAATGMVCLSWWIIEMLMWLIGQVSIGRFGRHNNDRARRNAVFSMAVIFLLICLFIPWQVAFLGSWLVHLYTCASSKPRPLFSILVSNHAAPSGEISRHGPNGRAHSPPEPEKYIRSQYWKVNNYHHNAHLLLLMTWLLPLSAPVLAVWVKTLMTAGFTTPFNGDHFFLNVAPFLILTDFASWTPGPLFEKHKFEKVLSVRWSLAILSLSAFLVGPRKPYFVFDVAKLSVGLMVLLRVGPRYWAGGSARIA